MDFMDNWIFLTILQTTWLICMINGEEFHEHFETLIAPAVYNKMTRPGQTEGTPTVVTVDLFVSSINAIDEIKMDFNVNMFLRQRWTDSRLAFNNHATFNNTEVTLNQNYLTSLWKPDLFFKNEIRKGTFHDITVPNILFTLTPDGDILFSQRLSTNLACNMKLEKYPLDNQTCYIDMESYGYKTTDLIFQWNTKRNTVEINKDLELPEFNLTNSFTEGCTVEYITGAFSCVRLALELQRLTSYYVIQVFVPTILIVMLSWVSFWIDHRSVPARISVGLLTVLTITTKASSISNGLPKVSYIKAIDVWMFTCTVFVFAALIEYAIVNVLARRQQERKDKQKKQMEEDDEQFKEDKNQNRVKIQEPKKKKLWDIIKENQATSVEHLSKILFPGTFIMFNIIFWAIYGHFYQI